MKFLAVFVALVGVAAALPEPAAEPETPAHATLDKRGCSVNCVTYCCQNAGCNGSLHCGGSYCYTNAGGYSWCECKCRYN